MAFSFLRQSSRDSASSTHLLRLAQRLGEAVDLVAQVLGSPAVDGPEREEALLDLDSSASAELMALMTTLRSAYLTPLPRQDLYVLAQGANLAVERVVAAGLLVQRLSHLDPPERAADVLEVIAVQARLLASAAGQLRDLSALEDTWIQLQRSVRRAEHLLTDWLTELADDLAPRSAPRHREIARTLSAAVDSLRLVQVHLGGVLVRES